MSKARRSTSTANTTVHRIGLLSDTHASYHPRLDEILAGTEEILHAGDIGSPDVITRLERMARVTAVSGNIDIAVPKLTYPAFARRDLYGLRILITHYVGSPDFPMPPVAVAIESEQPRLVLSGHTHKPLIEERGGILFVNPGSCGPRRFRLPCSCGILTITESAEASAAPGAEVKLYDLETGGELHWVDE